MPATPRAVPMPDFPCTIDDAIAYLQALRTVRPDVQISRVSVSAKRPEYEELAAAIGDRQPVMGSLVTLVHELWPDLPETQAHNLVTGARRGGYIHNRASRSRPAWYQSER